MIRMSDPRIQALRQGGTPALVGLWRQMRVEVQAQAYGNVFLIAGLTTLAAVGLAFALRAGAATRPAGADSPGRDGPAARAPYRAGPARRRANGAGGGGSRSARRGLARPATEG